MALIFTEDIVLLQNILKKLENVERSLHAYHEKMDGNISKTSEEVVNPPVSSLKKPGGTNVMKMTKFMVGTINILIVNTHGFISILHGFMISIIMFVYMFIYLQKILQYGHNKNKAFCMVRQVHRVHIFRVDIFFRSFVINSIS